MTSAGKLVYDDVKTAPAKHEDRTFEEGPCYVIVYAKASGTYPFIPAAPAVDFEFAVRFEIEEKNKVRVYAEGKHDSFPFYEAVVDGRHVIYRYDPIPHGFNGPGAGFLLPMFFETESVTIDADTR